MTSASRKILEHLADRLPDRETDKSFREPGSLAEPNRPANRELGTAPQSENASDEKDEGHLTAGWLAVWKEGGQIDVLVRQRIEVRRPDERARGLDHDDGRGETGLVEASTEVHA